MFPYSFNSLEKELANGRVVPYDATVLVCANLHKMNHVVKSEPVLSHFVLVVQRAINEIVAYEPGRFFGVIACLKLLRHSRHCSDALNQCVAGVIAKFGAELNATELYHFTAVLANSNYTHEAALRVTEARLRQFLVKPKVAADPRAHPSEFLRLKDVRN